MPALLLELFSEEIPARMQQDAAAQLERLLSERLKDARLEHGEITRFVTPRRLAIRITDIPAQQPDQKIERKGPKTSAPEQAVEGFLRSTGLSKDQLEVRNTGKDDCYFAVIEEKGKPAADALKDIIEDTLKQFSWPKSMRWGARPLQWVRPLHSILCLFDSAVIPVEFAHLTASNTTHGHRFMAPEQITLSDPFAYESILKDAYVMADFAARRTEVESQAKALAEQAGLQWHEDAGLLDEVTGLVEWPVCYLGDIDNSFMQLPPEVLISEMRGHQKYFALNTADGALSDKFVITANRTTQDDGKAVIAGNERVLRARLADGQFFWDQDRNTPLNKWAEQLSGVIFHAKLGSIKDKTERVTALAVLLAVFVPRANLKKVERAAKLSKADLVTGMVGEFPELQGTMGRYYAQAQSEDDEVADAIRDHYKPVGANDTVPEAPVSITVALADKLDSLVGLFAIGEKPTGSKDPYALRRAALGIISIIVAHELRMPLRVIIDKALAQFPKKIFAQKRGEVAADLLAFFGDRLKVILREQGIRHDLIAATFDDGEEDDIVKLVNKARALQAFLDSDDGANMLAAYRRASNILSAEEKKDDTRYDGNPSESDLEQDEEQALYDALEKIHTPVKEALEAEHYDEAMRLLAELRTPTDAFFDAVMVNADDSSLRKNRLFMLNRIREQCNAIANFGLIEG